MTYEVCLEVYEGPLNLLLALISDKRVDVCDVPVAELTREFLASLEVMEALDLEVTTEFLVVAATLLQLKSRALLPSLPEEEIDWPTERDALVARLLETRTFQQAGQWISGLLSKRESWFTSRVAFDDSYVRALPSLAGIDIDKLAQLLVSLVCDMNPRVDTSLLVGDDVTIEQAREVLEESLRSGPLCFRDLVAGRGVVWAVSLFLAIVEAASNGDVRLSQAEFMGELEIMRAA